MQGMAWHGMADEPFLSSPERGASHPVVVALVVLTSQCTYKFL